MRIESKAKEVLRSKVGLGTSMIRFCLYVALVSASIAIPQDLSPWADPKRAHTELVGKVVRYDRYETTMTANAHIVIKASDGQSIRLLYSPFDWGFDSPRAKPSQVIPPEMIRDGALNWKFSAHLPRTEQQKILCDSVPQEAHKGPDGQWVVTDRPLTSVPETEDYQLPPLRSLTCLIVERWTNLKTGAQGPDRHGYLIP